MAVYQINYPPCQVNLTSKNAYNNNKSSISSNFFQKTSKMTNKIDKNSLQKICRICMTQDNVFWIFHNPLNRSNKTALSEIIQIVFNVHIKKTDNLSQKICHKCFLLAKKMFEMRRIAGENNALQEKLANEKEPKVQHSSVVELKENYPGIKIPEFCLRLNLSPVINLTRIVLEPLKIKQEVYFPEERIFIPKTKEEVLRVLGLIPVGRMPKPPAPAYRLRTRPYEEMIHVISDEESEEPECLPQLFQPLYAYRNQIKNKLLANLRTKSPSRGVPLRPLRPLP